MPEEIAAEKAAALANNKVEDAKDEPRKGAAELEPADKKVQESVKKPGGPVAETTKEAIEEVPPVNAGEKH